MVEENFLYPRTYRNGSRGQSNSMGIRESAGYRQQLLRFSPSSTRKT